MRFRAASATFSATFGLVGAVVIGAAVLSAFGYGPATALAAEPARSAVGGSVDVAAAQFAAGEPQYSTKGTAGCLECHDETEKQPVLSIFKTPHAMKADSRTPFANFGCESCHGPSRAHAEDPSVLVQINFDKDDPSPVEARNGVCTTCHEGGLRMHWQGSPHQAGDVACASCHELHTLKDKVLVKASQPDVCVTCHTTQRAQMFRPSRHPIREGKVVCSQCHNPHGSFGPSQLRKASVNETCFECHAEKRGPFLWEHPPVRERCTTCHDPHGTTQPRMLKARGPFLCQQCHLANFHPSDLWSGTSLPQNSPGSRLLAKNCLNCHPIIHGSNHPSGARFTR